MKLGKKKYFFSGLLFIAIIACALLCRDTIPVGRIADLEEIKQKGKLRVVSENSSLGISTEQDTVTGFQYEILNKFANKIGVELELFMVNDLKECIDGVRKGKYHIVAKFIPATTEYQDIVAFTNPLLKTRQMLIQRVSADTKKTMIQTQTQLADDTIFISLHSPHKLRLNNLSDEIADTIHIVELENLTAEQLVKMVADGEIKYTICNDQLSRKLTRTYSNIDASVPVSMSQPYSWLINKQTPQLLAELNIFLSEFINSTDYWTMYKKYY